MSSTLSISAGRFAPPRYHVGLAVAEEEEAVLVQEPMSPTVKNLPMRLLSSSPSL